MDYYEELGVARTAAREEIRKEYKKLGRLLHPDQCPDDAVRRLADIQMKRLNGMLAVLSDPREREKYDLRLAGFDEPEYSQRRQLTVPPPRWLWPAVTM